MGCLLGLPLLASFSPSQPKTPKMPTARRTARPTSGLQETICLDEVVEAPPLRPTRPAFRRVICGDARAVPLCDSCVDLVVTSPPYWRKRDYGLQGQIGLEETARDYVAAIIAALRDWRRVLRPSGS